MVAFILVCLVLLLGLLWGWETRKRKSWEQEFVKKKNGVCLVKKNSDTIIIRKSKFPQNPKRSVRFSGKRTKRSVQKRKARNTQKAETKVL